MCISDRPLSVGGKHYQGAAPPTLLLTMGRNYLALSVVQELGEKAESRRKAVLGMEWNEWMSEYIKSPRKMI